MDLSQDTLRSEWPETNKDEKPACVKVNEHRRIDQGTEVRGRMIDGSSLRRTNQIRALFPQHIFTLP